MLHDPATVRYEVEKCIHLATTGRKGPVWIECPVDVQAMLFDPDEHPGYDPAADPDNVEAPAAVGVGLEREIAEVAEHILASRRPCFLFGAGVRSADAVDDAQAISDALGVPTLTSRLGMDVIGYDDPCFVGRPGTYGDRPANFAIQNCDLLVTVGCRMGIGLVGYDFQNFAPHAEIVMADIDQKEMDKPSVVPGRKVLCDAKAFLAGLRKALEGKRHPNAAWLAKALEWKRTYPVCLPEYASETEGINSYHFLDAFSDRLAPEAVVVCDTGSCFHVHGQAMKVKRGQRHVITGGLSTMGYCPAATGVAAATGGEVYCISGDGSFQFNIQELQTVRHNDLNIKFIIFNNDGYLLIRHTQNNFLEGRHIGTDTGTGVSFPRLERIAHAYDLGYLCIGSMAELSAGLDELLRTEGPLLCEVMTPPNQLLIPRVASKQLEDGRMVSMAYDNMFPFLSDEEYAANQVHETL
jgi:acetolactate synthase-1/2/3 large subunit